MMRVGPIFWCLKNTCNAAGVQHNGDACPGVIVSRLSVDFFPATIRALELVLEASAGIHRPYTLSPSAEWRELHRHFSEFAALSDEPLPAVRSWLLRLDNSFETAPASEWAGIPIQSGGLGIPRYFTLSQRNASRVECTLHGPALRSFLEYADRAGALLPRWTAQKPAPLLGNVQGYAKYVRRNQFPWADPGYDQSSSMVTDQRGNIERWLGFVYQWVLSRGEEFSEFNPPLNEILQRDQGEPIYIAVTPRGMNLFAASARVIEEAGLVPQTDVARQTNYVTLDQMAALVNKNKKTLERAMNNKNSTMPQPDVEGGGGVAHEWKYDNIRPWLEEKYKRKLPIRLPSLKLPRT